MFSFIKKRFLYRFIIVYLQESSAFVHVYDIKNNKIIDSDNKSFELEKKDELIDDIIEYVNKKQDEIKKSYIVTLVNSLGQGIIPTCNVSKFKDYNIDKRYIYNICIENLFTNYVTKTDIKWIQKTFSPIGIDFIFSPFVILKKMIENSKINKDETVLFILYHTLYATLIVFKNGKYIYGNFFNALEDKNPLYSDYEDNEIEEDMEEVFEIDELIDDDFDTDIFFELENSSEDENEELDYKKEIDLIEENKGFTHNISTTLKDFYSNKLYDSNFIDKVVIFTEDTIDNSVIDYIENELLLSVDVKNIDMDEIVLELCKEELF